MLSLNVLEASEDRFIFAVSILTLNDLILLFPNMAVFVVWNLFNQKCLWHHFLVVSFQCELYLS